MRKLLSNFVFFFLIATSLQAQSPITINQPDMLFVPGYYYPVSAYTLDFTVPSAGTNMSWDYSGLSPYTTYQYPWTANTNSNFPTATLIDSNNSIIIMPGKYYYDNVFYRNNATDWGFIGMQLEEQRFNIGSITGGSKDSATLKNQYNHYVNPVVVLAYPCTMGSAWHNSWTDNIYFNLTIAAYGLNKTPCSKVSHYTRSDSVTGWGTITVPALSGPSLAEPVLMVKRTSISKDSFFMNGSPASGLLLAIFGLSQGQQTVSNSYIFYRKSANYPMLIINFTDSFITAGSVYYDGLAPASGIENNTFQGVNIYPDPASNMIGISGAAGSNLSVSDLSGKKLINLKIISCNQNIDIENFHPGIYIVRITNENGTIVKKLEVVK